MIPEPLLKYFILALNVEQLPSGGFNISQTVESLNISTPDGKAVPVKVECYHAMSIYSIDSRKTYDIDITFEPPNEPAQNFGTYIFGMQTIMRNSGLIKFEVRKEGIHWFRIYHRGRLLGQFPLEVFYLKH